MRRILLLSALFTTACDGVVGELGEAEEPPAQLMPGAPLIMLECTPLEGDAPLSVTCALTVTHPDGKPVSCSVDPGTGTAPTFVGDCLAPQSLTFVIATEGQYRLRVTATDADGAYANATEMLTVHPRPNQAPVVDTFAAMPQSGAVPLNTTLTWQVSDPEGNALTCRLDSTPVDCAAGTAPWTVSTAGSVTVTLTVTDAGGLSATKTLTLTARMPVGDLRIAKVEWGQSVVLTDLKLVAGKPALLRVHVLADAANLMGVTVEASGVRNGTALGTLMLTGPSVVPTAEVPADLTKQWTADVPAAWIDTGLEVQLKVDVADLLPETDEANNVQTLRPQVGRGNVMQLTAVPVMHQGVLGSVRDLQPSLTRVWPLQAIAAQTRAPYTFTGTLTGGGTQEWSNLLDDIAQLRQMDGSSRNYYGFVRVAYQAGVAGIGYIGQDAAVGRDDSIETAQHELGHNMGRSHAPCGGAAGADPSFPYAGARIGSWGWDATMRRLMNPASYVDLMSYCQPEWISDYNYKAVQRFLEAQPYVPPSTPAPLVRTVVVSGRFTMAGASLRPVLTVLSRPIAEPPPSERHVRLTYASGDVRLVPIAAYDVADLPSPEQHFVALVEDRGPVVALDVLDNGRVVASRRAGPLGPTPSATLQRDGDALTVRWDAKSWPTVAVAHVDGTTRTTLALALTLGEGVVRVDGLPRGQIELSFSDGLNTALSLVEQP